MTRCRFALALLLASACCALTPVAWAADYMVDDAPASAFAATGPVLTVQTTSISAFGGINGKYRWLDGNWQSAVVGSDGNFYFGASSHSWVESASMFRYKPGTATLECLTPDIGTACHEADANGDFLPGITVPQGKLHSQLVEYNGWIYGQTHLGNYSAPQTGNYSGSHVLGWNTATGQSRDLGLTYGSHPSTDSYTAYSAIAIDAPRSRVFSLVTNWSGSGTQIVRQTIPGDPNTTVDHGDPNQYRNWSISNTGSVAGFAGFADSQGNFWCSINAGYGGQSTNAALYRVDPNGTFSAYQNAMPMKREPRTGPGKTNVQDPSNQTAAFRYWDWGQKIDADRYLCNMFQDGGLWVFDASRARDGDPSDAFTQINWTGEIGLGVYLAGNTLYFVDHGDPNNIAAKSRDLRLKSVDISMSDAPITDWGRIVDQAGRTPYRIETLAADELGHVFLSGDFRLAPGDPNEMSTKRNQFGENSNPIVDLWRGHFFGTVTVPEPTTIGLLAAGLGFLAHRRRRKA